MKPRRDGKPGYIGLDSLQCLLAVFPLADFLHQLFGNRDDVETAGESLTRDELRRCLFTDRSGIRHQGGLSLRKRRLSGTWEPGHCDANGEATSGRTTRVRVRKRSPGAEQLVVAMKSRKRDGAKGLCYGAEFNVPTSNGRSR